MIREAILAYADDLMSVTSSAAAQQVIADRMSAFCCFAGMEVATNKTEYVAINGPRTPPSLRVHGLRWDETIVPCAYDGKDSIKYLGISLPVERDERQSLAWAASMLSTTLKQLGMRAPPLSCKVYVLTAQIIPTVMYRATKAPWTLAQYRSLDRIISSFYRRIFKVERTFPEALIYMSLKDCGFGMKWFSDDAQRLKWSAIQRLLTSKGDSGVAAANLVERASRLFSRASVSSKPVLLTSVFQSAYPSSKALPLSAMILGSG
jgi:hypothetical protein